MKTLIIAFALVIPSLGTLCAKDGAFTTVIIPDGGKPLQLELAAHQWIKITNFVQNDTNNSKPAELAGIAAFKGDSGVWVVFAVKANEPSPRNDVIIAGPTTVVVNPVDGAKVFLTYQRGSD